MHIKMIISERFIGIKIYAYTYAMIKPKNDYSLSSNQRNSLRSVMAIISSMRLDISVRRA